MRKTRAMIKVLHVVNWLVRGGIETWLLRMLSTVDRAECQMDVCCKGKDVGALSPLAESTGARVYHLRLVPPRASGSFPDYEGSCSRAATTSSTIIFTASAGYPCGAARDRRSCHHIVP